MQARVVCEGRTKRVVLPNGESFSVDAQFLPAPLSGGGDCQIVVVPAGEAVPEIQARELVNALLANA